MATTTLNTRIQLKYDTYENWTTNNPVLLAGEVAVTTVQSAQAPVSQVPAILFKVGDGTNNFNALNWASAIAADVYPWAKASVKPTYQASEIEGLEDYISGQIEDTDTQYQIIASGTNGIQLQSRPKTGGAWTNVGSPITITYTLETGTTNGTVSFNGTEVAVKGLGSAAYTESSAYDAAGTAVGVQTAVIGTSGDQSSAITIYGTRKYAAEQATAAQTAATTAANSYTDGQITQAKTDLIGTGDATSNTIKGAVAESKTYTDTQIAAKIGSVYKPAGSVAFEDLPTPAASLLGNVYNVTNAFTADAEFITSEQGTKYPAGTNVVVVEVDSDYYYDALTGIVDLSGYATQSWVNGQLQTQSENLIGSASGVTANTIKGAVVEAKGYADGVVKVVSDEVDGIIAGTMPITLPIASDTHLGGVIIGDGLSVDPTGTLSVDAGAGVPSTDTAQPGDVLTWDGEQVVWAAQSGGGVSITLESIEIFTPPDRTVYAVGQTFDSTGLKVIARYNAGLSKFITNYTLSPTGALTIDDEFIIISYTEDGITKTTQQSITVVEALPVLNDNPWSTISSLSQAGQASAYWAVGDAKQITLNGTIGTVAYDNYQPWVFIMGFNHNAALEGNNLIHFGCFRADQDYQANNTIALDDEFYNTQTSTELAFHMNATNANAGGWDGSLMRSLILNSDIETPSQAIEFSFLAALTPDLQNALRKCTKYTNNVGNNNTEAAISPTEDWAFLLSEYEVQGVRAHANEFEQNYQQQYEYFANGNSKIKYKQSDNSATMNWWLRSPNAARSYFFCYVFTSGGTITAYASASFGFAPGFCV